MDAARPPDVTADSPQDRLRIAMALYGDVTYDSRVMREAETLSDAGHEVTIYCIAGSPSAGAPYRVVSRPPAGSSTLPDGSSPFLVRRRAPFARRLTERVRWIVGYARSLRAWGRWAVNEAGAVDVWHAHDLTGLMAVGPFAPRTSQLVYDSHEIFLETGTGARLPRLARRALGAYERRLTQRAVALVTVNEGYEEVLRKRLRPRRTITVRNCPPQWLSSGMASPLLRDAAAMTGSEPLVLYHGVFDSDRGIEQLAEALCAPGLQAVHLVLFGYGPMRPALEALARAERFQGRIHVLDAVPPGDLLDWVAGADVEVIPLQRTTLQHWLCTPNKLWESLAVGVPVVVSDFPVMRRIVLGDPAGPLGGVCDPASPRSIAAAIRAIVELPESERAILRARCLRAAHERWNWEIESSRLINLYEAIGHRA